MVMVSKHKTPSALLLPGRWAVHFDAGGSEGLGAFLPPQEVSPPADVECPRAQRTAQGVPAPSSDTRSLGALGLDGKCQPGAIRWAVGLEASLQSPRGTGCVVAAVRGCHQPAQQVR